MLALLAGGLLTNCAEPVEDIDRVQPNLYSKSLFQGEWYFARTVVDAPYETGATFAGDRQEYLLGAEDFPAYKVRWRIEQNMLFACRADEPTIGTNSAGRNPENSAEIDLSNAEARARNDLDVSNPQYVKFPCTHPVAAFPIMHTDVRRSYNAATGEQSNVIIENSFDRQWHERDYMRINWSAQFMEEIDFSLMAQARMGWASVSTVAFVQEEEGDCRQVINGITDYSGCNEGELPPMIEDSNGDGQTDSIMVTNRIAVSPDSSYGNGLWACYVNSIINPGLSCAHSTVAMRLSFSRVPQRTAETAYEELYYPDPMFERFGMWRVTKNRFEEGRGPTDFRHLLATRFHIWEQTNTCDADGCTPLPLEERTLSPIKYYLNREFPRDLVPIAFDVAKEWNDAMNGIKPGVDLTQSCQIKCGPQQQPKDVSECTAEDRYWRMEGTCAFTLDENNGSQFLGDLRYNYIAFIEDPGSRTPCGVGGPANDAETGELINGVAYIYGKSCFDYVETRTMDMVDVLCARVDAEGEEKPTFCTNDIEENRFIRGQHVLEIMNAQGYVQPPSVPIRGLAQATARARDDERVAEIEEMRADMEDARMNRGLLDAKRARVREAGLGRMMVTSEMARAVSGGRTSSGHDLTEDELELVDPLHNNNISKRQERLHNHMASKAADPAEYFFNDRGLWSLVMRHKDMTRDELSQHVREEFFKAVTLHELGHNMGMRHNFEASFDRVNYFPEYWDMRDAATARFEELYNRAAPAEFRPFKDNDETEAEFAARYEVWNTDRMMLRDIEHDLGIREVKYSSIMDYHGATFGDWLGLGDYDKASMRFLYAGLVDRVDCATLQECLEKNGDSDVRKLHDRTHVKWYMGGNICDTNEDCPYSMLGQNCQFSQEQGRSFCSNWDLDEKQSGRMNVRQMFCSDDRVPDQPFCNRFDEGESSEEIVRTAIEGYERGFIRNNFRHYRRGFSIPGYFGRIKGRYFDVIGNQMQSLLYKYFFEPGFRSNSEPGGFDDMFRATVIGFDFLGNILAQPEAGSYEWDEDEQVYTFLDKVLHDPNIVSDDLVNVPLGQGKTLFSSYEEGYFGEIERLNYIGVFYDKIAALEAVTQRNWGADAGQNDERFLLSFYDFFPVAFTKIIGAFMSGDEDEIGLLYDPATGILQQRTFWDGTFLSDEVEFDDATLQPEGRKIRPGASSVLSIYSLIYGYLNTPIWYDNSFNQKARVFEVGGETGFSVAHLDPEDYMECVSPISGRRFVATIYDNDVDSIGAKVLQRCINLSAKFIALDDAFTAFEEDPTVGFPGGMSEGEAERELRTAKNDLSNQENTINNMIHMIDIIGIGSL
jgi:hypothetical protein